MIRGISIFWCRKFNNISMRKFPTQFTETHSSTSQKDLDEKSQFFIQFCSFEIIHKPIFGSSDSSGILVLEVTTTVRLRIVWRDINRVHLWEGECSFHCPCHCAVERGMGSEMTDSWFARAPRGAGVLLAWSVPFRDHFGEILAEVFRW